MFVVFLSVMIVYYIRVYGIAKEVIEDVLG